MTPRAVYLDHNATTPTRPEAVAAMAEVLAVPGNASSVHAAGRSARARIDRARRDVAALVGAETAELVFTSGGTEANVLGIRGPDRPRVLVSALEHPSVLKAREDAEVIPATPTGEVDLDALERLLGEDDRPALVSVMLANNETGAIQPVAEVARLARAAGALVHCDAVQAAGKVTVDFAALGVDLLSLSAHKIGGPAGCGALVFRPGLKLTSQLPGGGQEKGFRAGTENLSGIVGFSVAATLASRELDTYIALEAERDALEERVRAAAPGVRVFAAEVRRLPNTSCLSMPGVPGETQVIAMDLAGIAVSSGSACSSGKVGPSHVLEAMQVPPAEAIASLRVSLGRQSGAEDIDRFVEAWTELRLRTANRKPGDLRVA